MLAAIPFGAEPFDTSEYMLGSVYATVVLLESDGSIDPDTENWTSPQIEAVKESIQQGLAWWENMLALQQTQHSLDFIIDFTHADTPFEIPYEPITRHWTDQTLWQQYFLDAQGFDQATSVADNLRNFNHAQRLAGETHWAFTIFVVNSENSVERVFPGEERRNAWADTIGYLVMQSHHSPVLVSHEVAHVFYALDEYPNFRSYFDRRGYYNTQNLNAFDDHPDPDSRVPSLMDRNANAAWQANTSSPTSLEMIGWRDTDGNGIFDVLDLPLGLNGVGQWDSQDGQYHFSGESWVNTLPNQNPSGLGNDITINTVSRVQYRIDGSEWDDVAFLGSYHEVFDVAIGPFDEPIHEIDIRTIADESGVTSQVFSGTTDRATATEREGVAGFVWLDANDNGSWDPDEQGLEGVVVSLLTEEGQVASQTYRMEPDDYSHRQLINTAKSQVTLSAFGAGVADASVYSWNVGGGSTGQHVFAHGLLSGGWNWTWNIERSMRAEFQFSVRHVSIDVISPFNGGEAEVQAYAADGRLLESVKTERLNEGDITTLQISRDAVEIDYVVITGFAGRSSVRLDNLQFAVDAVTTSNRFGYFHFDDLEPERYTVTVTPNHDVRLTFPATGQIQLDYHPQETPSEVIFGVFPERTAEPAHNLPPVLDVESEVFFHLDVDKAIATVAPWATNLAPGPLSAPEELIQQSVSFAIGEVDVPSGAMTRLPEFAIHGGPGTWPGSADVTIFPVAGWSGTATYEVVVTDDEPDNPMTTTVPLNITVLRRPVPTPYRNPVNPFDVNVDGRVNAFDVLLVVGYLHTYGAGEPSGFTPPFVDVAVPDNYINPFDALAIVSYINALNAEEGFSELRAEGEGECLLDKDARLGESHLRMKVSIGNVFALWLPPAGRERRTPIADVPSEASRPRDLNDKLLFDAWEQPLLDCDVRGEFEFHATDDRRDWAISNRLEDLQEVLDWIVERR